MGLDTLSIQLTGAEIIAFLGVAPSLIALAWFFSRLHFRVGRLERELIEQDKRLIAALMALENRLAERIDNGWRYKCEDCPLLRKK